MTDPKLIRREEEGRLLEGETLYQGVRRVVDAWAQRDSEVSVEFPKELKVHYPEALGEIPDKRLGVVCALLWMHLGGKPGLQKHVFMKWWADALGE